MVLFALRRAVPETAKLCGNNDMVLLDSGGQYVDGTTGNLL